jgi:histidine triad (HIT) family protein
MDGSCVFCRIIAKELPATVVFEDEAVLAFMDIAQLSAAHVLVVPKSHAETIDRLPIETAGPLMEAVVQMAHAIRLAIDPAGISVWQSNGEAAGQEVPHVHVHVLAREPGDKLMRINKSGEQADLAERERRARLLRDAISE